MRTYIPLQGGVFMEQTTDLQSLHGLGPRRIKLLNKLGIYTTEDLILYFPRAYIDLSNPQEIMQAPMDEIGAVLATVVKKSSEIRLRSGIKMYKVIVMDDSGTMELTFFNTKYTVENLKLDNAYLFYGRMEGNLLRRAMNSPTVYPVEADKPFVAVYSLTAGLSSKVLALAVEQALQKSGALPDCIPCEIRKAFGLENINRAIWQIHFPQNPQELENAKKRLVFEELFVLATGLMLLKTQKRANNAPAMQPHSLDPFYQALPFTLTDAQKRAIKDLVSDMQQPVPANRLVQGDVGSGKTMVAAAGAYFAYCSGFQSAMMAPTELLAQQHYESLVRICEPLGMQVALLTGSMTPAQKKRLYERLQLGEVDLCIGTHALISKGVAFYNLGLVMTDEQHRFGVAQRAALAQKGNDVHTLVMSATPIPRTLALMIYGELEVSVIDELPPGRMPVMTYKISSGKRERAFGFIKEHLDRGLQAYIVCPLVEQKEELDNGLQAATDYIIELGATHFSGYTVGLLHGKMKAAEKDRVMADFKNGTIQLLISTTVVEVGVDVPRAVIMMVENAERFGLSQLHQLRGRVGRGREQSYCILLSDSRNEETLERLQMMCKSNNGFEIAEYDLKTRGPGNFLGQQQHGLPRLRIADLGNDTQTVEQARQAAHSILEQDPTLSMPAHQELKRVAQKLLTSVGTRPN